MPKAKPVLVFDATVLSAGNKKSRGRSGVFWATFNLFQQFLQSEQFVIQLYCRPHRYLALQTFLKKKFPNQKFTFVNQPELYWFNTIRDKFLVGEKHTSYSGQHSLKYICHTANFFFRMTDSIAISQRDWRKNLASVSYFFSSGHLAVPTPIAQCSHIQKIVMLYDAMVILFPHFFPFVYYWYLELIQTLNDTDLYFTDSESCRQDFLKIAPQIPSQHITTTYISTNQPYEPQTDPARVAQVKAKYHIPTNKSYVFSLCTMNPHKNIPFAIDGFIRFCQQYNVHDQLLVLGGSATDKRLDKYKNSPYVKFIGYVDDEDLQTLYSAADTFVYPSLYEGFGMPILEAMSCGCPVICSNTSSMPEVIGDCGILIDPTNEQDLINALHKMHTDATFRQTCREKGLARAKQFSWKKCVDTILSKLQQERVSLEHIHV